MIRTFSLALIFISVVASVGVAQEAPSGELLYTQHCALCHEGNLPRIISEGSIRDKSAEEIYQAITFGFMRRQASGLSPAGRRAVAEYLSGSALGSLKAPIELLPDSAYCGAGGSAPGDLLSGATWNGWGVNLHNTRFQSTEAAGLTAAEVPRLRLRWAFGFPVVSASGSQATIVGGRVLVGSRVGLVFGLDAQSGCMHWVYQAEGGVRSAITVGPTGSGRYNGYFGDSAGRVYAIDFATGEERWKVQVEDHADVKITGAPVLHGARLYVPVASSEEVTAIIPTYECCTFRGSIVALDAATGRQVWKTYAIAEAPRRTDRNVVGTQRWGPSGAGIWSAPTVDAERNRLYVTTGDSYSDPAAPESDAIMALDMDTGQVLWVQQTTPGDAWTVACEGETEIDRAGCPDSEGPDVDYGSSPVLTTLPGGQRVLLAGQKSGVMYGLSPDTGELLWETRVSDGGILGGIEWGFATDGEFVYASISDAYEKEPGEAGGLAALRIENGEVVWEAPPIQDTCGGREGCHTGQPGAVTAIPGVVFSGSLDGHFRAYSTESGAVIWDVDTVGEFETVNGVPARGGSINGSGATIVGGMLYVTSGYGGGDFMPGNVLLAFSIEGR